jgi:hypothetical protein
VGPSFTMNRGTAGSVREQRDETRGGRSDRSDRSDAVTPWGIDSAVGRVLHAVRLIRTALNT